MKTFIFQGQDTGIELEEFPSWEAAVKKLGEDKALDLLNAGWIQRQRGILHSRLLTAQGVKRQQSARPPKPVPSKQEIKLKAEIDKKAAEAVRIIMEKL